MITHGKKQISEIVYARKASEGGGAVRLTNIIRGAQVVFGGLKPSFGWLEKATKAAILAAFGAEEGAQVIRKTNDYLNAIALTDPQRAQQLAMFINEDPMLVCSLVDGLGVVRGIVTDNNSWIDTGFTATGGMHVYCTFKAVNSTVSDLIGSHNPSGNTANSYNRNMLHSQNGKWHLNVLNMGSNNEIKISQYNKYTDIEFSSITSKQLFLDTEGTRTYITGVSGTLTPVSTVKVFYSSYLLKPNCSAGTGCAKIIINDKDEVKVREMYPYIKEGVIGMIDCVNGTFYPKQGSGELRIELIKNSTISLTDK